MCPLNKMLSAQCSFINNGHVVEQICRTFSPCIIETLCPLVNNSSWKLLISSYGVLSIPVKVLYYHSNEKFWNSWQLPSCKHLHLIYQQVFLILPPKKMCICLLFSISTFIPLVPASIMASLLYGWTFFPILITPHTAAKELLTNRGMDSATPVAAACQCVLTAGRLTPTL